MTSLLVNTHTGVVQSQFLDIFVQFPKIACIHREDASKDLDRQAYLCLRKHCQSSTERHLPWIEPVENRAGSPQTR